MIATFTNRCPVNRVRRSALLVFALRENPEIDDEELDDLAVYGVKTFRAMTREQRNPS
jgi:hypothetical protein